jgi:hypothetical protein
MKATTFVLGAVAVAASSAAAHFATELRSERAENETLRQELAVLAASDARRPATPVTAASAATPPAAATGVDGPPRAPARASRIGAFGAHPTTNPGATFAVATNGPAVSDEQLRRVREEILAQHREHERRMREDPDYRTSRLAQHKMNLRRIHVGVEAELGLTAAETDALYTLLAEDQLRMMNEAPIFMPGESPTEADLKAMQERRNLMAAELDARLREHLGDARYAQWQAFQESGPARWTARNLRDQLAYGSNPLTTDQERRLAKAIASEQQTEREWYQRLESRSSMLGPGTSPADMAKWHEERLARTEASHRRLHDAASQILDAEQLRQFDAMNADELAMQRSAARAERATPVPGPDPAMGVTRVGVIPMPNGR